VPGSGALVVGESLVDVTRSTTGQETVHPGGSPLNVAVGLARLGQRTTLATQIGDDAYGRLLRAHLAGSGVVVAELGPPGPTGRATAQLDAEGRAAYTFDLRWDPDPMPSPAGFDVVHVGSLGAALDPGADRVATLARDAGSSGARVSLDPNLRPALTPDLTQVRRRTLALAATAAIVKLSDEDAALLFPGRPLESVAADIMTLGDGVELVAITLGRDGALLRNPTAQVRVPADPVHVVDSIGAGDAFMASLLVQLIGRGEPVSTLDERSLAGVGAFACRAAAVTCSRPGADPPWRDELEREGRSPGPSSYTRG